MLGSSADRAARRMQHSISLCMCCCWLFNFICYLSAMPIHSKNKHLGLMPTHSAAVSAGRRICCTRAVPFHLCLLFSSSAVLLLILLILAHQLPAGAESWWEMGRNKSLPSHFVLVISFKVTSLHSSLPSYVSTGDSFICILFWQSLSELLSKLPCTSLMRHESGLRHQQSRALSHH